jgi:hypothetical protein
MTRAENPFEPRLEGVPLSLTLDGRSLSRAQDESARERDFLLRLAAAPVLDVRVLDWPELSSSDVLHGRLAAPDVTRDMRVIEQADAPGAFFGAVQPWSSREKRADRLGLRGTEREWFLYYEAVTWYHRNSARHLFVTSDRRLLRGLEEEGESGRWSGRRIVTVRKALQLVGWMMLARELLYLDAEGTYTRSTTPYTLYFKLTGMLGPARKRLHEWIDGGDSTLPLGELGGLEQSMFARVMDLLRARGEIALQCLRTRQDNATLDEILYHLRGAFLTATALADSIAVFAQLAFGVEAASVGGLANVSLAEPDFRKELRRVGAGVLATRAADAGPLWKALRELRNPVAHRAGLSGVTFVPLPGPAQSRISLSAAQGSSLEQAAQSRGAAPRAWGIESVGALGPQLDPLRFADRFIPSLIAVIDQIVDGLADDLGAAALPHERGPDGDIWKLALLAGVGEALPPGQR